MTDATETQDTINRRVYHARGVDRAYRETGLDNAEIMALLKYQPAIAGRDVLDLGVGAGRTTRYVAPLAARYVAADYSPVMVEHMRRRRPEVDVRLLDMRDLHDFGDASFDVVLAVCNLLDAVSHEDRLRTLAEIRRVLREGGLLLFSSHNRRYVNAGSGPMLSLSRNPITQLRYVVVYARQLRNHRRMQNHLCRGQDYALLNDVGNDYATLHYYVDRPTQARQLDEAGFALLDAFARDGRTLAERADDGDTGDILYVARKTTLSGGR